MLKDKTVIITGGTRGIGFATVKLFLENGANVVLLGSRSETVEVALKNIDPKYKSNVFGYAVNLNDKNSIEFILKKTLDIFGKIDVFINNAGVSSDRSFFEYDDEEFEKIIDLNVNAVYLCSKLVAEIMKKQGGGVILNTSSMVSLYGQPSGCAYPTSKYAVNGLTKSLARELGKYNIRVNAVAPGIVNTDMVKNLDENLIRGLTTRVPLNRMAEPIDVANAFLYLASPMASYVTGVILSIDGGIVV